jgi:hypothetical protein
MLSLLAIPPIAYPQLCTDIESIWQGVVQLLFSEKATRYLILAWIDIKEGRGKKAEVSWLARLGIEGTVAHPSADLFGDSGDVFGDGVSRRFAAFLVSDWDWEGGALCILKMAPRSMVCVCL